MGDTVEGRGFTVWSAFLKDKLHGSEGASQHVHRLGASPQPVSPSMTENYFLAGAAHTALPTEGFPWLSKPHDQWAIVRSSPARSGSQPYSGMVLFPDLFLPWEHCFSTTSNGCSLICYSYFQSSLNPLVIPHHSKFLLLLIIFLI